MDVVISGTSRGSGKAMALKFLAEGHRVFGFDLRKAAVIHPAYHHLLHDVRNEKLPHFDVTPHIVISNAGTLEERDAIETNLFGAIRFVSAFKDCPSLRSILFVASASARNGSEFPMYVASKAGVVGFMKNLALKVASRGITCNSISPGGVITHANDHILNDDNLYQRVLNETLLGKWAQAAEIAELAYYLTVVNRSITGEDILIDNGEMLKSNFIW